ncbi:MAG: hypothetical protein Q9191_006133 [Dirinaria sp. TL-2023a]
MTQAPPRAPSYLQPRPKAVATLSDTSSVAKAGNTTPPRLSRPSSESRNSSRAPTQATSTDGVDKTIRALIRRVLCPNTHTGATEPRSVNELLPPLTSSNEIDLQLYAIIAIIVKELVYSWYGKITPDQGFVEEVVSIIAHCTRAIEGRIRSVDLEALLFDEIPELIENHVRLYRISHSSVHGSAISTNPRVIYHKIHPHPALSPVPDDSTPSSALEQSKHEAQYRQLLVQSALAVLLPTEDLENACLRTLVADVIAESILGNAIGGKMCEGSFIWGNITKITDVVKARVEPKATGEEIEVDTRSRLEKYGLLSERDSTALEVDNGRSPVSAVFWRFLQYAYLAFVAVRFVLQGFVAAYSEPLRSASLSKAMAPSPNTRSARPPRPLRPLLSFKVFSLISTILDLPLRMPWALGSLSLGQHHLITGPFKLGATDGLLDQ